MKTKNYHFYALLTVLLWASAFVFTKIALRCFTSPVLGLLRYCVASVAILIIVITKKIPFPKWKDIPLFFVSGAFGFTFYMILFNKGSETLSSSTGSIILATAPIITALLAFFVQKERLQVLQWIAIGIEFAGILILTLWNGILSINAGVIWMVASALLVSLYNLIQRKLSKTYTSLQCASYSIFTGTIMLLVFLPQATKEISGATIYDILVICFLGIFPSAIAYIAWSKALSIAKKASQVSNYMFVTPFLTTILGFLMIGEIPDLATLAGGITILFGIFLFYKNEFFRKPVITEEIG